MAPPGGNGLERGIRGALTRDVAWVTRSVAQLPRLIRTPAVYGARDVETAGVRNPCRNRGEPGARYSTGEGSGGPASGPELPLIIGTPTERFAVEV